TPSLIVKPAIQFRAANPFSGLNRTPFLPKSGHVTNHIGQRPNGSPLSNENISDNCRVANCDVPQITQIEAPRHVVQSQQKPVLHRMVVDERRKFRTPLRRDSTTMQCNRAGYVNRLPAHQTATPGQIGVFAVREKVLIEVLPLNSDNFESLQAVNRGSSARTEDVFSFVELSSIGLIRTSI